MNYAKTMLVLCAMALALSACKKKPCKDEWPEGFEFYELSGDDEEAVCTEPLIKGWDTQTPAGNEAKYSIEITPLQGVADVTLFSVGNRQFKKGDSFETSGNNNQNQPNSRESSMFVSCDDRWYNQTLEYWIPIAGTAEITDYDSNAHVISLTMEYEIANASDQSESESYRVVLEDYQLNFNPH